MTNMENAREMTKRAEIVEYFHNWENATDFAENVCEEMILTASEEGKYETNVHIPEDIVIEMVANYIRQYGYTVMTYPNRIIISWR